MFMCEHKAVYNRCDKKLILVKKINMLSKTEQNDEHFRASLQYHYGLYDVIIETYHNMLLHAVFFFLSVFSDIFISVFLFS